MDDRERRDLQRLVDKARRSIDEANGVIAGAREAIARSKALIRSARRSLNATSAPPASSQAPA